MAKGSISFNFGANRKPARPKKSGPRRGPKKSGRSMGSLGK
jgi:hypothetical protein